MWAPTTRGSAEVSSMSVTRRVRNAHAGLPAACASQAMLTSVCVCVCVCVCVRGSGVRGRGMETGVTVDRGDG